MSLDSILGLIQTALELGCIYALVALALFLNNFFTAFHFFGK